MTEPNKNPMSHNDFVQAVQNGKDALAMEQRLRNAPMTNGSGLHAAAADTIAALLSRIEALEATPSTGPISQTDAEALAHRIATTYTHRSEPGYSSYAFVPHTLMHFVRAIEASTLKAAPSTSPTCEPLESLRYWIAAYSTRASGDHFQGHGMVVKLLRDYEQLLSAPQAAQSTSQWQPIETAPMDGTVVLAFWQPSEGNPVNDRCYAIAKWVNGDWCNAEDSDCAYAQPTAWMPLPAPEQLTKGQE